MEKSVWSEMYEILSIHSLEVELIVPFFYCFTGMSSQVGILLF
jgi:hypothetical protein